MFKRYLLQIVFLAIIIIASFQSVLLNTDDGKQLILPTLMPFPDEIVVDIPLSEEDVSSSISGSEVETTIFATPVPSIVSTDIAQGSDVVGNANNTATIESSNTVADSAIEAPNVTPLIPSVITNNSQQNPDPINQTIPTETVAGQVVIHFASNTSPQERAEYIASIGGTIQQTVDALNTVVVTVSEPISELPQSNLVVESEPDYYATALVDISSPPSDPYYAEQWALPVIGAPDAWAELPDDAPLVTVAVIDSGVCLDHPDLAGRILAGYDFVDDDAIAQDELGHGCGVAGIIAANIDNGIGIAGVAPNAMVMPVRVLDANGIGTYSDVAAGIVYAVDNGAEIINLSLGGANHSTLLEAAVDYAIGQGVTIVAAAGNTGGAVLYPAKYEPVIAVGSFDQDLQPSSFSANGAEVDVWAPGRDILMTGLNGTYVRGSGTSFASPMVLYNISLTSNFENMLSEFQENNTITTNNSSQLLSTEFTSGLSYPFRDGNEWKVSNGGGYNNGNLHEGYASYGLDFEPVDNELRDEVYILAPADGYIDLQSNFNTPTGASCINLEIAEYDDENSFWLEICHVYFEAHIQQDVFVQRGTILGKLKLDSCGGGCSVGHVHIAAFYSSKDEPFSAMPSNNALPFINNEIANLTFDGKAYLENESHGGASNIFSQNQIRVPSNAIILFDNINQRGESIYLHHENNNRESIVLSNYDFDDRTSSILLGNNVCAYIYDDENSLDIWSSEEEFWNKGYIQWLRTGVSLNLKDLRQMRWFDNRNGTIWNVNNKISYLVMADACNSSSQAGLVSIQSSCFNGPDFIEPPEETNPPTGTWNSPTPNQIANNTVSLSGEATDSESGVGVVQFTAWWNGVNPNEWYIVTAETVPSSGNTYSFEWNLCAPVTINGQSVTIPNGDITLGMDVSDVAGNIAFSPDGTRTFNNQSSCSGVDISPPSGSWTSPTDGQTSSDPTLNLSVDASDNTGGSGVREVRFSAKWNGVWSGIGEDTTAPYSLDWDWCSAGVPEGDVELGMEVWDNASNKWVYSENFNNIHVTMASDCGTDTVTFYANPDYSGAEQQFSGIGNANFDTNLNDQVSSIDMPSGWSVELFEHPNLGGGSICLTGNSSNLNNQSYDDRASSFIVFDLPECQSPATGEWYVEYFDNPDFTNRVCTETISEPMFNRDWNGERPCQAMTNDETWSARFTASFDLAAGDYYFHADHDDGARWLVSGQNVIAEWTGTNDSWSDAISLNGIHSMEILFRQDFGQHRLNIEWYGPSGLPGDPPIPPDALDPELPPFPATMPEITYGDGADGDLTVLSGQTVYTDNVRSALSSDASTGQNVIVVNDATGFSIGDEILIIGIQGQSAGRYAYHRIASINGNNMMLEGNLQLDFLSSDPAQTQVIRVPNYQNLTIENGATLTAHAWNGATGGVIAFRVSGTLFVADTGRIFADGIGYRGSEQNNTDGGGQQGENEFGIVSSDPESYGMGGGGGCSNGYGNPSGGGGGGHIVAGGDGQPGLNNDCFDIPEGGSPQGINSLSAIFFGGGGGNGGGKTHEGPSNYGGGIVLAYVENLQLAGTISANGDNGQTGNGSNQGSNGGGGAGGTILLAYGTGPDPSTRITVNAGFGGTYGESTQDGGDGSQGRSRIFTDQPPATIPDPDFGNGAEGDLTILTGQTIYTDDVRSALAVNASYGTQSVNVQSAIGISVGDEILIIQMQGLGVGQYEFARVSSISANQLTLQQNLTNAYLVDGNSNAQVIRVPNYANLTIQDGGILTAHQWNGATGGVVAFRVSDMLSISSTGRIDASGIGYRGASRNNTNSGGVQGESENGLGTRTTSANGTAGGGGCSNGYGNPAGAGGGGHATQGQNGSPGNNNGCNVGGIRGFTQGQSTLVTLHFGGAGGSGGAKTSESSQNYGGAGGDGGGIIITYAREIQIAGTFRANGANGQTGFESNRGANGGGGAGGAILLVFEIGTLPSNSLRVVGGQGGFYGPNYSQNGGNGGNGFASSQAVGLGTPNLLQPSGLQGNNITTFAWTEVLDATGYDIEIYDSNSLLILTDSYGTNSCTNGTCTVPTNINLVDGNYSWRVRAYDTSASGSWSALLSFEVSPQGNDYHALIALYNSTDGDNWLNNTGWLVDEDVCNWFGIICDLNDNVTQIFLFSNNLNGTIPPEIGDLANLTDLALVDNSLSGTIPSEVGNLSNLIALGLTANNLSDTIPASIWNLTNLQGLLLERNNLTGTILPEIGNLVNLIELRLNSNDLSGTIPNEIGSLTQLYNLNLSENSLSGNIPVSLWNLTSLNTLNLRINNFGGDIPTSISNLSNLNRLYLDGNNFTGNIPIELTTLQNLVELGLFGNQLTGSIPPEIANMTNLSSLILNSNQFTGMIPVEIGNLNSLSYLSLGDNQFTGDIPAEIWSLNSLGYLDLSDNQLTGFIPPEVGNLISLNWLDLSGNLLTGSIPSELGNLNQNLGLRTLDLSNNALSGEIPSSLTNLTQLNLQNYSTGFTDIGFNSLYSTDATVITFLNDKDPDWADTQTIAPENVQVMGTTGESITISWDTIAYTADGGYYEVLYSETSGAPYENSGCTTADKSETSCQIRGLTANTDYFMVVRTFTLAYGVQQNDLFSDISAEVSALTPTTDEYDALVALYNSTDGDNWNFNTNWLVNPDVCTWYGITCDVSGNVAEISLDFNNLVGTLPSEIGNFPHLEIIVLERNELSGTIPVEIGLLSSLRKLDFNWNQLTGTIPAEIAQIQTLEELWLGINQLSGSIPNELATLPNLYVVGLGYNQLTGPIPSDFGNSPSLLAISFIDNQLTGAIPPELGDSSTLEYISVAFNQLEGPIPPELGNLINMNHLDVSHNALVGEIPQSITNLVNLTSTIADITNFDFNALYTSDATVLAFMNGKDPDWADTQTIAPSNVQITATTETSVTLAWDVILYTADGGYYEVLYSETSSAPYENSGCTTADKTETSCEITGLTANTDYFMVVRTFTPAHDTQQNDLFSDFSGELSASTDALIARGDCNADTTVDAGDLSALQLEIFDGDSASILDDISSGFAGNPIGCDSNADTVIDAGDLSCTQRIIFDEEFVCGVSP